ncbi:MAG: OmpA family protein, partial [Bacteroidales bacterium]|nr:OmpA family protein [Bacteroidales bacterium]
DRMIIIAIKNPNMIFEIEAHADERGSQTYNLALTDRRLASTVAYVEKKGFDTDRLVPKSYGKSRPLIKNARTEEEHRLNRRVTFRLFNPQAQNQLAGTDYPVAEVPLVYSDNVYFKLQLGAFRRPLENPFEYYQDVLNLDPSFTLTYYMDKDGLYKYNVGDRYADIEQVRALVQRLLDNNRECYIAAFYQGHRITVSEALAVLRHQSGL